MWAVVRYNHGVRHTDMRGESSDYDAPSVDVDVYDTESEAKLRAFDLINTSKFIMKYNLFITEVENR